MNPLAFIPILLASTVSEGSLPIITGIAGLAVGFVIGLLIFKKNRRV